MVKITGAYGKLKTWVTTRLTTHTAIASAHHTNHEAAASESASFKEVDIAVNEAYKQGTDIILRIKELNTFVGIDAGKVTTGGANSFMGYTAGEKNSSGIDNTFMGSRAGYLNETGYRNSFVGATTGYSNYSGYNNFFGGYICGYKNTTGYDNTFMGSRAGYSNNSGYNNTFMGSRAGYKNTVGHGNIFMGNYAGYHETGSLKLFIDMFSRSNEADGRIKALIYGVFASATTNQVIRLNGILELTEIKNGNTQANAGAAINEVWKTNGHATLPDNVLMIGV